MKDIELFNDHFQNYKTYGIPKAQLIIADIPYNVWWYEIVADLRAMQYQPSTNFKRSEND